MRKCFIVLFFLAAVTWISAEGTHRGYAVESELIELSLMDFIELACSNDRVFEEILIENLKLHYHKKLKLPADDIIMSVKNRYVYFPDHNKGKPEYRMSLGKLFPFTGTSVEAGYLSTVRGPGSHDIDAEFYAMVSQPVARNAFGRTNRLLDGIAGLEEDIARYQVAEAYERYLASLIAIYYDWYEAYENLRTAENSYRESERMLDNIRERKKSNIALPVDVNKVLVQSLSKKETLISARNDFRAYTDLLRRSIGYDIGKEFIPGGPDIFEDITIDFQEEYEKFRNEGRTSVILDLLEEKSSLEVDRYADALLPSVEIFAGYSLRGTDRGLRHDEKRFQTGFSIEYPFPGQVQKAEYEVSRIEHTRSMLERENTHIRLYTELRNIYAEIEKQKKLIEIASEKIRVSEEIVADDTENYSFGRVNLNNLIDEINRLDMNRFLKIQRTIRFKKLIVEWLSLTDKLVEELP